MEYQKNNQDYMKFIEVEKKLSNTFNVLHDARNKSKLAICAIESENRNILLSTLQAYYCVYYSLINNSQAKNKYFYKGFDFNSYTTEELANLLNYIIELIYEDEILKYAVNESKKYLFKEFLRSTGMFSEEFLSLI